jgi:hypothetical protein
MKLWYVVSALALVVSSTGCDEATDSSSEGQTIAVNAAAAEANAEAAITAALAVKQGEGAGSVRSFVGLGSSALALLAPGTTGTETQARPQLTALGPLPEDGEEGVDCSDVACTFDGYSPLGTYVVNGTLSWADDHLVADLSVNTTQRGMSFVFNATADLVLEGESLDGVVETSGHVVIPQAQQYGADGEADWTARVEYHDLSFADGKPSGGSLDVSATLSTGDASYDGNLSLSFP